MIAIRRILCPVDFSDATRAALAPALRLVDAFEAELFLLHAVEFPYESVPLERYYLDVEDQARLRLADLETDCREIGRRTQTVVVRDGPPHDAIVSFATREAIDLIVMPTHSRHGVDRLLAGSVSERVVQSAGCPVLVVPPPGEDGGREPSGGMVFATDFSEQSNAALSTAAQVAARLQIGLTLVHVVTIAEHTGADGGWLFQTLPVGLEEEIVADGRAGLAQGARMAQEAGFDGEVPGELLRGVEPSAEILGLASDRDAAMIVVASHGHSRMVAALLGSTAAKLVRTSTLPVFVIRPAD